MYLTCCLWYIIRSHTPILIHCVWSQRPQTTSDLSISDVYTHPLWLWKFRWPHFNHQLSSRSTNLHLKLEKPLFRQGTTTPQLSSGPRRGEISGDGAVQCQHVGPLAKMPGPSCWGLSGSTLCMQSSPCLPAVRRRRASRTAARCRSRVQVWERHLL